MSGIDSARNRNVDTDFELGDRELDDLGSGITDTRELASEIEGMRRSFMNRVETDSKGVVSEIESHGFIQHAKGLKSRAELKRLEEEFSEHVIAQRELMGRAAVIMNKQPELLNKNESEEIINRFPDMSLRQKEAELEKIQKMMQERERKMENAKSFDAEVRARVDKKLSKAEDYDAKLKVIEAANETNKLFGKYKKAWRSEKISSRTKTEYMEWFLDLDPKEQKWALAKVQKEDIDPRENLFDLHEKIPAKYKNPKFKNLGRTERISHLEDAEHEITQEYLRGVWSKDTDMSTQSKSFAIRSFEQIRGKDPKVERYDRIIEKAKYLDMFPGHAKAEGELRTQLEKFTPELYSAYMEQFNRSSFDEKTSIIKQIAKQEDGLAKSQSNFDKFDREIRKHFDAEFSKTIETDSRDEILTKMEKFRKHKTEYFNFRNNNDKYFSTDISIYEKWYAEHITDEVQAKQASEELKNMISKRKKMHESFKKLDSRVQERCDDWDELSVERKIKKLRELQKLESSLEAIDALKETAATLENSGMPDKALDIFKKARKLDPGDRDINKSINRLAKELGLDEEMVEDEPKKEKASDGKVESDIEDDFIIDAGNIDFDEVTIKEMQRAEEAFDMVKDNVNALGGNIEQDAKTRARKEYSGTGELEREIIEEVSTSDRVVDRRGKLQRVIHTDIEDEKDLREIQNEVLTPRRRDVKRGVTHVEIETEKGDLLKTDQAKDRLKQRETDTVTVKVIDLLARLKSKGVEFNPKQQEAVEETLREQAHSELRRKVEGEKIYKRAT